MAMRNTLRTLPAALATLLVVAAPAAAERPRRSASGSVAVSIASAQWRSERRLLEVEGRGTPGLSVILADAGSGARIGTTRVGRAGSWELSKRLTEPPCGVTASDGRTDASSDVAGVAPCAAAPALLSVVVDGPDEVDEGSTITLVATATFSDGSSLDVGESADWSVAPALATVASGSLTASEVDADRTVTVTATYSAGTDTASGTHEVTIRDLQAPPVQGSHAGRFTSYEGTATCLDCHMTEALAAHASVHYQWRGDAGETVGLDSRLAGKLGGINDFCIYPDINWIGKMTNLDGAVVDGGCSKCHAGLGLEPDPEPTREQLENVDCLICHSANYRRTVAEVAGRLRWVPDPAGMGVSALQAAVDITLPDSARCLNCHTKAGGGDNFKRGDIEEAHRAATASFDVHLAPRSAGGAGLQCLDCHAGSGHRIAGRGVDLRPRELPETVACESCHSARPHDSSELDRHTARVGCTTCHVRDFAQVAATDMRRDWSAPGDVNPASRLYEPHMLMASHVRPEYRFFNGRSEFYQFGSRAAMQPNGRILMAGPLGDVGDAGAKIVPLKHHTGRQPIEPLTGRLLPLKIGIFFQTGDTDAAVRQGAEAVGWELPAGYEFAETERFMGIFHEVRPDEQALGCSECHGGSRLDFAALGYTPNSTRNGRPLCTSCHEDEEEEEHEQMDFFKLHEKHVRDKRIDCANCHSFSAAN